MRGFNYLVSLTALTLSSASYGALVTFDFGEDTTGALVGSGDDTSYVAYRGSVMLTGTGYKGVDLEDLGDNVTSSFDDTEAVTVDTNGGNRGLAVDSGSGDDDGRLDGDGPDEAIWFDLSHGGLITAIAFDNFGGEDDFSLVLDGLVAIMDLGSLNDDTWTGALAFGSSFAIGADGASDAFRIRSVTVDVPEPTTGLLFGLGMLGMAALKRRQQQNRL